MLSCSYFVPLPAILPCHRCKVQGGLSICPPMIFPALPATISSFLFLSLSFVDCRRFLFRRKKQTCSPAPISPPRIVQWIVELLILTQRFHYRQYCRVTAARSKVDCRYVLSRFFLHCRLPYLPSCFCPSHSLIVEDIF